MPYPYVDVGGVEPPKPQDQQDLVFQLYCGDTLSFRTKLAFDDGTPVLPNTTDVTLTLVNNRFSDTPIWSAGWDDGIRYIKDGVVEVIIPAKVTGTLRRGSFLFSVLIVNKALPSITKTALEGTLLIEYAPTSPQHTLDYKNSGFNPDNLSD